MVVGNSRCQRITEKDNGGHGEVKDREGRREEIKRRGRQKRRVMQRKERY